MKTIDEIINGLHSRSSFNYQTPFVDPAPVFTEMDYKIVNRLFEVFQGIFPAFKQAWPTETEFEIAKREWMKAFKQVGLNDTEMIAIGVSKFRLMPTPFVPSPGQFIALCTPDVRPQWDTRDKADFKLPAPEIERRHEVGRAATKELLKFLRG